MKHVGCSLLRSILILFNFFLHDSIELKYPSRRIRVVLVRAIIGGKDLDCGSAEFSVNLGLTHSHGSLPLDL